MGATKTDKSIALGMHRFNLLVLTARAQMVDKWCSDPFIFALVYSRLLHGLVDLDCIRSDGGPVYATKSMTQELLRCFSAEFLPSDQQPQSTTSGIRDLAAPLPTAFRGSLACAACQMPRDVISLSACSICRAVFYCGAACQALHWHSHRNVCAPYQSRRTARSQNKVLSMGYNLEEAAFKAFLLAFDENNVLTSKHILSSPTRLCM
jgi:hypothetical protein